MLTNCAEPQTSDYKVASNWQNNHSVSALLPFLWTILCVVIPFWIAPAQKMELPSLPFVLSYMVILYAGSRIALVISAGEPVWLPFMFWSFTYIWIGLAMFAQDLTGNNPYNVTFSPGSQELACVIALTGMIAFDVGGQLSEYPRARPSRLPRVVDRRRLIVLFVLTLIGVPLLLRFTGSLEVLFTSRAERSLVAKGIGNTKAVNAAVASLIMMAPLIASACFLAIFRTSPKRRRRPGWLVAGGLSILFALVATNPISSPRFMSGAIVLGLLFSLGLTQGKKAFRITSSSVFMGLLLLFPYSDLFRYKGTVLTAHPLIVFLTSKGDYDTAAQMVAVVDYRQATGGTNGNQILGVIGFFIPRSYWPSKPGATGDLIVGRIGYPYTNVSSPLWVEAYIDGGFIGVIIAFIALGYVMTRLSKVFVLNQNALSYSRIMIPLIAAYSLILLRGSLMTAVAPLTVMLAIGWFVTRRERENRPVGLRGRSTNRDNVGAET